MMLGQMDPLQENETRYLELRIDDTGRIQITDNRHIVVLIDGGGGIPAQIQKDIIGVALGIEENPNAVDYFDRARIAQRIDMLIGDCKSLMKEYEVLCARDTKL